MKVQEETFDSQRYWDERLRALPNIRGVGYVGRSSQLLEMQYRSRIQQLELALHDYRLTDLTGCSVLDVGPGTGIWLDFWHQHGAEQVVGLDFAQSSVDLLKKRFSDDLIVHGDVTMAPLPLPDTMRFDVISIFDVLLHITKPGGFQAAIANLAHLCAPGGWLIISDAAVQGRKYVRNYTYGSQSAAHSLTEWQEVLEAHGFTIDSVRPATVLLANPLEAPNYLTFLALSMFWKSTKLWGRSKLLVNLVAPSVIKADQLACSLFTDGSSPTAKLIFARKQD